MKIEEYQAICSLDKIAVTKHARIRLEERGIHMDDKPLHFVISRDEEFIYLITAYFPDIRQWENDFKTRKEH